MIKKSLRQLAKELGVTHAYLSQVKHGKRPLSPKVVSKMVSKNLVKTGFENGSEEPKNDAFEPNSCYTWSNIGEWCSGSTGDFGSSDPGSNPGSPANFFPISFSAGDFLLR